MSALETKRTAPKVGMKMFQIHKRKTFLTEAAARAKS